MLVLSDADENEIMTKRAYAILTVPRKTDYIHQTIKSLETSGFFERPENLPLNIFVGCPDDQHLAPYFKDPRFEIHRLTPEEEVIWSRLELTRRATFAQSSTMKRMLGHPWDELLIFEDDTSVALGWMDYLEKAISEVRKCGNRWILSLYYLVDDTIKDTFKAGKRIKSLQWQCFWGMQANIYPREIAAELYLFLIEHGVDKTTDMNGDGYVCRFAKEQNLPLFTSVPSLVQHIGYGSTGLTPYFHTARCFFDPVVDPAEA